MPARKTARKAKVQEFQSFLIDVVDWEVRYGFSLDIGKHSVTGGPYWEHVDLSISGTFTLPEKLVGQAITVSLLGDRREDRLLDAPDHPHREPLGVGGLTVRGERREYLGSIPLSAVWGLVAALHAGKIRSIALHGEAMKRGNARIRSIDFARWHDPEEW